MRQDDPITEFQFLGCVLHWDELAGLMCVAFGASVVSHDEVGRSLKVQDIGLVAHSSQEMIVLKKMTTS